MKEKHTIIFILPILLISLLVIGMKISPHTTPTKKTKLINTKQEETKKVSFVAVGDNIIHDKVMDTADQAAGNVGDGQYDFKPIYQNVKSDIQNADISFVNQETVIGGGHLGYPSFNSPDAVFDALKDTGFDVVNGASNHAMDTGTASLQHMIQLFKNSDMKLLGLYENAQDTNTIPIIDRNGIKIAFLSYTYGLNNPTDSSHVSLFDQTKITNQVNQAKSQADFIVVSAHWGDEYQDNINKMQEDYAKLMIDLGVDLVVGTHPHTIQPAHWYTNTEGHKTLVLYSLGNFVSGQKEEKCMYEGMFECDFVMKDGKKSIENTKWIPLINYFEAHIKTAKTIDDFSNVRIYKASQFTQELSNNCGLTGYKNMVVSKERCLAHTKETIKEIPVVE